MGAKGSKPRKTRQVTQFGAQADGESEEEPEHHIAVDGTKHKAGFRHQVTCPEGHAMRAKVVREMFVACCSDRECDKCEEVCNIDKSHYHCHECDYVHCNQCAREHLGLKDLTHRGPPVNIKVGDILLAGPDKFGIHHVILVCSGWHEVDHDVLELLDVEPGSDVLCCETIESTQGSVGTETWWYKSTTYFVRHHEDGALLLVADMPPDSDVLEQAFEPVPTKLLLHPFRTETDGPEMDEAAFLEVIEEAASRSVKYGKRTAVKSVVSGILQQERIKASDYATAEQRRQLAKKLKESWKCRPICASVAVKCWQQYFFRVCADKDEAVQQVLKYMPHWCDESTPSSMVHSLTEHDWILTDVADGWGE